jgi:hypothetical protein
VDKHWSKPVFLALEGPGKFTRIADATEASWALIEDWPLEDGAALDRALLVCAAVAEGKKSPEEARRAFLFAAAEAGIQVRY